MSDEIFINTGTSFQQQYTARQPAIGTAPTIGSVIAQAIATTQTPFTYQRRSPANYNATGQTPFTYQHRTPSIYQHPTIGQQPFTYDNRQPATYPRIARQPATYARQGRLPSTYDNRQPATYPRIAQVTYQHPFTYQHRTPSTYARQGQTPYPYIASGQQPTANQNTASAQAPSIANAQTTSQQPYAYQAVSQTPYIAQGRTPSIYNATGQVAYNFQQPAQQPYPYIAQGRQPSTYQHRNPFTYAVTQAQSTYSFQQPAIGQQPYIYSDTIQTYFSGYSYEEDEGAFAINNSGHFGCKYVGNDIILYFQGDGNQENSGSTGTYGTGTDTSVTYFSSYAEIGRIRDAASGYTVRRTTAYWSGFSTYDGGDGSTSFSGTITTSATSVTSSMRECNLNKVCIGAGEGESRARFSLIFEKSGDTTHTLNLDMLIDVNLTEEECPGCCVHVNMTVETADGEVNVSTLSVGDMVYAYDFLGGGKMLTPIVHKVLIPRDCEYQVNDLLLTEDHPIYLSDGMRRHKMDGSAGLSGGRRASVNPELTMVNYGLEVDQLVIGDVMMKGDGTTEEVTSITAYAGTHDNYALLTKQGNWYANGVMVDSVVKDLNIEDIA